MIIKFTTKRDINGNRYTLEVDHNKKTYNRSYNTSYDYSDFIQVSKKDREKIIEILEANNYTQTF